MSDQERIKILDKAKKLEALAIRGVDGEKETAFRMLSAYMTKHNISEKELRFHRQNQDTFRGMTKEEIYQQFEEEMNMKGMFILGKGTANILRNADKLKQFKSKMNKPIDIDWREDNRIFNHKGYINGIMIFDVQETKSGATLYPTNKNGIQQIDFHSLQEAKIYCEKTKGYFS